MSHTNTRRIYQRMTDPPRSWWMLVCAWHVSNASKLQPFWSTWIWYRNLHSEFWDPTRICRDEFLSSIETLRCSNTWRLKHSTGSPEYSDKLSFYSGILKIFFLEIWLSLIDNFESRPCISSFRDIFRIVWHWCFSCRICIVHCHVGWRKETHSRWMRKAGEAREGV